MGNGFGPRMSPVAVSVIPLLSVDAQHPGCPASSDVGTRDFISRDHVCAQAFQRADGALVPVLTL